MSELVNLENGIVNQLSGLEYDGGAAFATVRGYGAPRSDTPPVPLLRERMPAAYVCFRSNFYDWDTFSEARYFSVFIAARSLRAQDEARHGTSSTAGLLALIELTNGALDQQEVYSQLYTYFAGGSMVSADSQTLVMRLTYVSYDTSYLTLVYVDGESLFEAGTPLELAVGQAETADAAYRFAGADGELRQHLGVRPRPVTVRGLLRAASDAALSSKEAELEALVTAPALHVVSDSRGRLWSDCVARAYRRLGARGSTGGTLSVSQAFALEFEQLVY